MTIPNVERLNALQKKMAELMGTIEAPIVIEEVVSPTAVAVSEKKVASTPAAPKMTRDLKRELEEEKVRQAEEEAGEMMDTVFGNFDSLQDRANALRFQHTRTTLEEAELVALDRKIVGLTKQFAQDLVLHAEWIALHLDRADEHRVSCDFVARGILREITFAEKEKNSADWAAYKMLSQKEKDSGEFLRPSTVWTVREDPRDQNTAHYFVKLFVPKDKWPDGKNPWTEEKRELLAAYVAHHTRMREEATQRRTEREAVEAERQLEDQQLQKAMDPDIDPNLTLEKIGDGSMGLARIELLAEHDWKSHPAAPPMTGLMYIRGGGLVEGTKEIGQLQIVGATGGLRGYLSAKGVSFAQSFHYKVGRQFAGISEAETREDKGFLRALFAACMGYKKSHVEDSRGFNNPLAALGGGEQQPVTTGRQNGHGKPHQQGAAGGKSEGRRHSTTSPKQKGGGNSWRNKFNWS